MKKLYATITILLLAISAFSQVFSEKELLQKLDADLIEMDKSNEDGTFKARNKTTQKWGMYQFTYGSASPIEMIPMNYDSLQYFGVNEKFTVVYNKGKLGIYLCYFDYEKEARQTVACLYENYKIMLVPYKGESRFPPITYTEEYLAVKKNGKWGWVNWFTGEEQSKFIYDSPEDLPVPAYLQEWM